MIHGVFRAVKKSCCSSLGIATHEKRVDWSIEKGFFLPISGTEGFAGEGFKAVFAEVTSDMSSGMANKVEAFFNSDRGLAMRTDHEDRASANLTNLPKWHKLDLEGI